MGAPRGFTVPLRVAENAATLVAGLVVTTGAGVETGVDVGVDVGAGVGDALTTITVPTMPQHPPCGVQ